MGLIADTLTRARNAAPVLYPPVNSGGGIVGTSPQGNIQRAAPWYGRNEIVYAAIELLASSAGEPHICGRRWRRNSPGQRNPRAEIRSAVSLMQARGVPQPNRRLALNGYVEELPDHPLVEMLNAPNPFLSRGQFYGTAVMDRYLAGNFYAVKARSEQFPNAFPLELWRMRPDRVKIIPGSRGPEAYEYRAGTVTTRFDAKDVLHWKTRNPYDDFYGMPPLMPLMGRLDIDWYMQAFLRGFYESGGSGPGSILTVKQRLTQEAKEEVRDRFKRRFGMPAGAFELMILDQAESSYQQLGLNRGLRDALPKELDAVSEARIAMVFGIPGSILGLLIGYESSSYANKKADWQVFWDITMTPLLSDLDDVLNLSLTPEFSGIDEVYFDLDDIKALQEDVDKVQDRERKNFQAGLISLEEARDAIGRDPDIDEGLFFVPSNYEVKPFEELGEEPDPPPAPVIPAPEPEDPAALAEARCGQCNRLLGRDVVGARFDCPRCKTVTEVVSGRVLTTR